jgi:carbonic anhydrase
LSLLNKVVLTNTKSLQDILRFLVLAIAAPLSGESRPGAAVAKLRSNRLIYFPMSAIDDVLSANAHAALSYEPNKVSPRPSKHLAILTCMDTRITLAAMGLLQQDAHMIRNAGGIVTDDALRSLLVSHYMLGTNEVMVINHTDCGMMKASEEEMHDKIERAAGLPPSSPVRFYAFQDVEANVREQMKNLESHSWVRHDLSIRGFVFDVSTGKLREVKR